MHRRKFLTTTLLSIPALAFARSFNNFGSSSKAFVVKSGKSRFGVPTPFYGVNPNDLKLSTKDTNGALSTFYYEGFQKIGPSLHSHLFQDEAFYILKGKYIFQLGDEKQLLSTGDLIFLPRNIPHTWVQISENGEMFYFLQPAGKMEEFFLKMTEIAGKSTEEEMARVRIESGIKDFGPGLKVTDKHIMSDKLSNGFIVKNGESRFNERTLLSGLSPNDIKISSKDTNGELSIFEYNGKTKGGPPLHLHLKQDEIFYIDEGNFLFQCGEDKFSLEKGDMIFLPRGVPHTWAQLNENGKLIYFFQPSGKMEDFFRTVGGLTGVTSQSEGEKLFEDHEMKIVGPPLIF